MLAAFVGYGVGSIWGAVVAGQQFCLPSFILMFSVLPLLEHVKRVSWMKAALQGISPAVIGVTAVAVLRMVPYVNTGPPHRDAGRRNGRGAGALAARPLPLMAGGAAIRLVLHRSPGLPAVVLEEDVILPHETYTQPNAADPELDERTVGHSAVPWRRGLCRHQH